MAEVVEAKRLEADAAHDGDETAGEVAGGIGFAKDTGEDEVVIGPCAAECEAVLVLGDAVTFELFGGGGGEGDVSAGAVGLGWTDDDAFAGIVAGAAEDLDIALSEVGGGPLECEEFALAHAGFEGKEKEGFEAGSFGGGKEVLGLGGCEAAHFEVFAFGQRDGEGWVDLEELPFDGLGEGLAEDVVVLEDGSGGESGVEPLGVGGLDVGGAEVEEAEATEGGPDVVGDDTGVAMEGGAGEAVFAIVGEPLVEVLGDGKAVGVEVEAGVALVDGVVEDAVGIAAEALDADDAAAAGAGDGVAGEFEADLPGVLAAAADVPLHGYGSCSSFRSWLNDEGLKRLACLYDLALRCSGQ